MAKGSVKHGKGRIDIAKPEHTPKEGNPPISNAVDAYLDEPSPRPQTHPVHHVVAAPVFHGKDGKERD